MHIEMLFLVTENVIECFLRQLYRAYFLHLPLAFLLVVEMLQLSLVMSCCRQSAVGWWSKVFGLPPYKPAVTSALIAESVSRAIIFLPIAACIGTSKSCLGMTLSASEMNCNLVQKSFRVEADVRSFFTQARPTSCSADR
jgi:hypothetical protein